jgi:hypothetical protein
VCRAFFNGKENGITKKYVFQPEIIHIAVSTFKDNISSTHFSRSFTLFQHHTITSDLWINQNKMRWYHVNQIIEKRWPLKMGDITIVHKCNCKDKLNTSLSNPWKLEQNGLVSRSQILSLSPLVRGMHFLISIPNLLI